MLRIRLKIILKLVLLCSLGVFSICEGAVTIDVNGRATGVTELDIGGIIYDVVFRVEQGDVLWPDRTKATFWNNESGANAAILAINEQLNKENPVPQEVADPSGKVSVNFPMIYTIPVEDIGPAGITGVYVRLGGNTGGTWIGPYWELWQWHRTEPAWSVFTPSCTQPPSAIIPAPSALVLSLIGAMSLLVNRQRRRQ